MNPRKNWNCDNEHCTDAQGEIRVLPTTPGPYGGNALLCRACYEYEMRFRRSRNAELGTQAFDLPAWDTLKVYGQE